MPTPYFFDIKKRTIIAVAKQFNNYTIVRKDGNSISVPRADIVKALEKRLTYEHYKGILRKAIKEIVQEYRPFSVVDRR